jgi:hypothetical protein
LEKNDIKLHMKNEAIDKYIDFIPILIEELTSIKKKQAVESSIFLTEKMEGIKQEHVPMEAHSTIVQIKMKQQFQLP